MDVDKLPTIILGLVVAFMLIGVGVLALDKFETTTKTTTTVTDEEITIASSTATLAHGNLTIFSVLSNASNSTADNLGWSIGNTINYTALSGVILVDDGTITDGDYNVTYTYRAKNSVTPTINAAMAAIGDIGNTWASLIVTILILAVILTLVLRSFGRN